MFKLDFGRKNIVFLYIVVETICLACCSVQQNSNLNQDSLNLNTEILSKADLLIDFLDSVIPNVAHNCADGLELSPFMDIQPNDTSNQRNLSSPQVEFKQLISPEEYTKSIKKHKKVDYGDLLNNKYKCPEKTYSKMYLAYLKTLKESGKMHKGATVFQDLHPDDKLSYLQKNPPITGSILADEPKVILRRKKPNLFAEETKKVEIGKGEFRKSESLFDMIDGQKSKLRKMHSHDKNLKKLISSYDLVIEELKAKLKSIKDRDSEVREKRLQAISKKLSGYKCLVNDGKSKLDDLERSQLQFLNTPLLSQPAVRSRVFELDGKIGELYCWYDLVVSSEPQYCSKMKIPLNRVCKKKNPVSPSESKETNLETSHQDRLSSHLSILSRVQRTKPSEIQQNKLRWQVQATGAERSNLGNNENGSGSEISGESIQNDDKEGIFHATYVEVGDSSDEDNSNDPVDPNATTQSILHILKLLKLDLDLVTNKETVDRDQSNVNTSKFISKWRGRVNGTKRSSSADQLSHSDSKLVGGSTKSSTGGVDSLCLTCAEDSSKVYDKNDQTNKQDLFKSKTGILKVLQLDIDLNTDEENMGRAQFNKKNKFSSRHVSTWKGRVSGTKRSNSGNKENGSGSEKPRGFIQHHYGKPDTFHATYAEVDDSSDELN
ncbi:hypothetical protein CmeUKMEL1_16900 [Cryptosporidium meleagridis]|uniref:Uncharacterized protein n=1 Tax=Cryptosporidium meleagridis TaxID=93969 RepID=A0A2P4Z5J6_9CRYT|nr:hypothetical protein CmeUKMEL1_16900 [Cryptosporidium meleagridis]